MTFLSCLHGGVADEEKWNLPALTRRDAAATSPLGALDLTAPPAFLTPPRLPAPALA